MWTIRLVQSGQVPDWLVRLGIRIGLRLGLRRRYRLSSQARRAQQQSLLEKFRQSPIAINTADPNWQHYEVPSPFFELVLGRRLKYSCCYWPPEVEDIDTAEEVMLELTCQRARLEDGLEILELGCGWGSLCLWIAERYPNSQIVAVSNSRTQKDYIDRQARQLGLSNLRVLTADMNHFAIERHFDRVLSVEMFEHMKNYELLLARIARWLKPAGLLFVHHFSHRELAWEFDASDPADWMARTFFSGGTMPSDDLLRAFQRDLEVVEHWQVDGTHYGKTLRAWLDRLDRRQPQVRQVLAGVYGTAHVERWLANWRLFFISCEETFNLFGGTEFLVSHYLCAPRGREEFQRVGVAA